MPKTFLDAINRAEAVCGPVITVPEGPITLVDTASAQTLSSKTLTAPTLNSPIINDAQGTQAYERLITTRVLTAADSGKTFGLALANGFTVTLPTLAAGLAFKFLIEIAPTTAYIIASAEGDNISLTGGAADGAAIVVNSAGFSADQVNLVASKALIGDIVDIYSVGTAGWAAVAIVGDNEGVTISG